MKYFETVICVVVVIYVYIMSFISRWPYQNVVVAIEFVWCTRTDNIIHANKLHGIYNRLQVRWEMQITWFSRCCVYNVWYVWKMCHKILWHVQQQLRSTTYHFHYAERTVCAGSLYMLRSSSPSTLIYGYIACLGIQSIPYYSNEECKLQTPLNRSILFDSLACFFSAISFSLSLFLCHLRAWHVHWIGSVWHYILDIVPIWFIDRIKINCESKQYNWCVDQQFGRMIYRNVFTRTGCILSWLYQIGA